MPHQRTQRTGASRYAHRQIERHRRLALVADLYLDALPPYAKTSLASSLSRLHFCAPAFVLRPLRHLADPRFSLRLFVALVHHSHVPSVEEWHWLDEWFASDFRSPNGGKFCSDHAAGSCDGDQVRTESPRRIMVSGVWGGVSIGAGSHPGIGYADLSRDDLDGDCFR